MENLNTQIEKSADMFILAAKECGFKTAEQIEENFELVALVAAEMVKKSKDRILTKFASNDTWMYFLASRYQQRVLNQ